MSGTAMLVTLGQIRERSGNATSARWFLRAIASLGMGDLSGYNQVCEEMIATYHATQDVDVANAVWLDKAAAALGDNARHGAKPISSEPAVAWYDRVINDLLFREASARLDQPVASAESMPD